MEEVRRQTTEDAAELVGLGVLIVEDTLIVAREIDRVLRSWGCRVVGPCPNLAAASKALAEDAQIAGALLDVNLGHEDVYPLAAELERQGVPFIFLTGYRREAIPPPFEARPILEKPFGRATLLGALRREFLPAGRA